MKFYNLWRVYENGYVYDFDNAWDVAKYLGVSRTTLYNRAVDDCVYKVDDKIIKRGWISPKGMFVMMNPNF